MNRSPAAAAAVVRSMYGRLFRRWGSRGWWPTTPPSGDRPLYRRRSRRSDRERFEICLGALLTQNTSWSNVTRVLRRLQADRRLNFASLRRMTRRRMEGYFRSSGYFRQKTRRVRAFLERVDTDAGGSFARFLGGPTAEARKRLLALSGVGPETADSMLLYAGRHPIFVVDAYTRRIGKRWGLLRGAETYDEVQRLFSSAIRPSASRYGDYHALLVELGKTFCRPDPLCGGCPARGGCDHASAARVRAGGRRS